MEFRWNSWNREHVAAHGVTTAEAEFVVECAKRPYPLRRDDDKWLVWGRTADGRLLQVVFVFDDEEHVFVIHARPLTNNEKGRLRRQRR